jgi:archaellum component FlaC
MANIEGAQDEDLRTGVRTLSHQMGMVEHRLDGVEHRLDGVEHRLDGVEHRLGAMEQRIASVEATLQHVATKADLHQALNAQTWKMAGFGATMLAATFALARYL